MKALQLKTKIIANRRIMGDYYNIALGARGIAERAMPGQFVSVKIDGTDQTFLRRPFSLHRVDGKKLEVLYAVVGEGTRILSQKKPGELLDIIGPLGNSFGYERRTTNDERPILVAGGMGVAPLLFLAEQLVCRPSSVVRRKILVLLGAKNKKEILCAKEFKKLGCEVKISTDDGSLGFRGKVTDLLRILLRTTDYRLRTIYSCGPRPMLRQISRIALKYNIPAQISLEEHMSCAIGACMGCVVDTRQGYKRVCKEGPVFAADEIIWSRGEK